MTVESAAGAITPAVEPAFPPLRRNRMFRLFMTSETAFSSGVWAQTLVLSWLAFELTQSELAVAVFTAGRLAPSLLGPFAGLASDRFNRIYMLSISNLAAALCAVLLALAFMTDVIAFWQVMIGGVVMGITQMGTQPIRSTLVFDMVGPSTITSATALQQGAMMGSRVIAPAIAGALISRYDAGVALWFSVLWFIPSAVFLFMISDRRGERARGAGFVKDTAAGFRAAGADVRLFAVLMISVIANIFAWPILQGMLPVFAEEVFDSGANGLGILFAANGLGSLVGAIAILAMGDIKFKGLMYIAGTASLGITLSMFAVSGSMPLATIFIFLNGLLGSGFGVMMMSLTMLLSPPDMRGRMMGVLGLAIGVLPFATLAQGAAADAFGVVAATAVSGVALALSMVVVWVAVPGLRRA